MKILLISQYFWPETFIINELAKCIVEQGHTVEVLTAKPNYPNGDVFDGYSILGTSSELFNETIPVHRIPIFPRGKGGAVRLLLNYLSFVMSGILYFPKFIKAKKFDMIFVFAPSPITSVIPAIYIKKRFKVPLTVWVQDLWPESLSATGFVKNKVVINLVGKMVSAIYNASDMILAQSCAFVPPIAKYAPEHKIAYYPNSYRDTTQNQVEGKVLCKDLLSLLEQNKCFVFAGNLGTAQSLDTLVNAAMRLKHLPDCKLVLVGSGSMSDWVSQQMQTKQLDNLIVAGRYPSCDMPAIFSRATALVVTLRKDEIFRYTIPSKIQAYLEAGRPIIAALDGEGGRIIEEAGAGFSSDAEDSLALSQNIERLYHMPDSMRNQLGQSGRDYFLKHFEMEKQTKRLLDLLESKISEKEPV